MGSESSPLKLPVIDFSVPDLKPGSLEWDSVKSEVRKAAEEHGYFVALFSKISQELKQETASALEEVFELPLQTKQRNVSEKLFHGYLGPTPESPLSESLTFDDPTSLDKVDAVTSKLWPQGNPTFSKAVQSCSKHLSELDRIVRQMIGESLGLEKYMDEHMNSTDDQLRVSKYKGPETSNAKIGLTAHTDKSTISILFENQISGLEVQTKDGEWITAELNTPHSVIVLIGDCLHAWTNGRLRSAPHRVVMTGNKARYSVGFFSIPKRGYIIKTPEEVIDEEHPLLYKPWELFELLDYFFSEAGKKDPFPLRTFCGV